MITKKSYLQAKKIVKDYETQQLNTPNVTTNSIPIPPPPPPPLDRVLREGAAPRKPARPPDQQRGEPLL